MVKETFSYPLLLFCIANSFVTLFIWLAFDRFYVKYTSTIIQP